MVDVVGRVGTRATRRGARRRCGAVERQRARSRPRAISGSAALDGGGDHAQRPDLAVERWRAGPCVGSSPWNSRYQTSSRAAGLGELDRVVLAVVVEALEAADVADLGLGDDDAFEAAWGPRGTSDSAGWICATRMRSRIDTMPTRRAAVDDRDVAVAVLGEARERGADLGVGRDVVGVAGHPLGDPAARVGAGRGESDQVPFGEDADRAGPVDDDDRADALVAHPVRGDRRRSRRAVAVTTGRLMMSADGCACRPAAIRPPRARAPGRVVARDSTPGLGSPCRPAPATKRADAGARARRSGPRRGRGAYSLPHRGVERQPGLLVGDCAGRCAGRLCGSAGELVGERPGVVERRAGLAQPVGEPDGGPPPRRTRPVR